MFIEQFKIYIDYERIYDRTLDFYKTEEEILADSGNIYPSVLCHYYNICRGVSSCSINLHIVLSLGWEQQY
jgi:hypothetical protein